MSEFRMPTLGADMEAGTLVQWLKHPGDVLTKGDIIAVVETQKGAIEIEVFETGVLEAICVEPGEKVPVGTVLASIRGEGERPSITAPVVPVQSVPPTLPSPPAAAATPVEPVQPAPPGQPRRSRVSPLARRLAADLGVDLTRIEGSGDRGAVTRDDVERAAAAAKTARPGPARPPVRTSDMRAAIAAAMSRSKREIPHYYLSATIDMSAALQWLAAENERRPVTERLLPAALLLKAVALGLRETPELNGYWADGGFKQGPGINIGCAISLRGGGLVAPALRDADRMDLRALMRSLADLVARARSGALRSSDLIDPTITVTNLGDLGVDSAFGIIYPPQVALVGFGRIAERPWVVSGRPDVRPLVSATLAADHRATDGHRGGQFLTAIDRLLQRPETL